MISVNFVHILATIGKNLVLLLLYHDDISTHRGVRPYQCAYCEYRATVSDNVGKHCRQVHKNLPQKWVKVAEFEEPTVPQRERYTSEKPQPLHKKYQKTALGKALEDMEHGYFGQK